MFGGKLTRTRLLPEAVANILSDAVHFRTKLVYNKRKAYHFADAAFERGPYYYAVYSQAVPPRRVLTLAELVHKRLAG